MTFIIVSIKLLISVNIGANKYISVISKGSCDTEVWSNDAGNAVLITGINYIWTYIHIEYFKMLMFLWIRKFVYTGKHFLSIFQKGKYVLSTLWTLKLTAMNWNPQTASL